MAFSRRRFLARAALAAGAIPLLGPALPAAVPPPSAAPAKPLPLRPGDLIGLSSPGGYVSGEDVEEARLRLQELGFRTRLAPNALGRRGYLAGPDAARAADLHTLFDDDDVRAIVALRGGWGAARLLPLLDFERIAAHPKALIGYSDVTALLLALYARSGLVTFHGPVGISNWNDFTMASFQAVLMSGRTPVLGNPPAPIVAGAAPRLQTVHPGKARGRLVGGNLSVLAALLGSPYLPDWRGHVLFLEDVGEEVYRVDRMLTQLRLAGVLDGLAAFIFGQCTRCKAGPDSLSLRQVLDDHLRPLGIPAWLGAPIGHVDDKLTLPLGVEVEVDADLGTIRLLEPAVRMA